MSSDPFQYVQHKGKRPGYAGAVASATAMRSVISYAKASRILSAQGLELSRNEYYNLEREENKGALSKAEELTLLLDYLEQDDFRVRLLEQYDVNDTGEPVNRVVKAIGFTSSEMIRLARKFVSEFGYLIDSTFSTNKLYSPYWNR